MFERLKTFLKSPSPQRKQASAVLRQLYLLSFFGQVSFAVLLGWGLAALSQPDPASIPGLSKILLPLCLALLATAPLLALFTSRAGGKTGALAAAITLGALMAIPSWFAALLLAVGGLDRALIPFVMVLAAAYAVGLFMTGGYASMALRPPKKAGGSAVDSSMER